MNLELKCDGFYENVVETKSHDLEGIQYLFRFDNDYGASVVKHLYSYGSDKDLWELAVIQWDDSDDIKWRLTYTTPVSDDVEGYLTDEEVTDLLKRIKEL